MSTATITQQQAEKLVKRLEALGAHLEFNNNPDWLIVARAAAMIESLRLGLATISPYPVLWVGIDMGKPGADQTVTRYTGEYHAN